MFMVIGSEDFAPRTWSASPSKWVPDPFCPSQLSKEKLGKKCVMGSINLLTEEVEYLVRWLLFDFLVF